MEELVRRGLILQASHQERNWQADPVGYVREVLQFNLWAKQAQILAAVRDHRRVAVRSCHSSGKTVVASCAVHWWLDCFDPALVLTTAPTSRQVKEVLWNQIGRLHRKSGLPGTLNTQDLVISPTKRAFGFTTNEPERFQGWHEENILVIVDEASGVAEEIYEAIEGILTSTNARLLLIGNPNTPSGAFYRAFTSSLYHPIHIAADEVPYPPLPPFWAEERKQEWGEESPVYQVRVMGEFPDQGEDHLFSMRLINEAVKRWEKEWEEGFQPEGPIWLGFDVARQGADASVLTVRQGNRMLESLTWRGQDTMASVGRVAEAAKRWGASRINVDETGMGYGVLDRLLELGLPAVGVNVGEAARDSEHYANRRAEIFFGLAERFKRGEISVPDDSTLMAHLTSIKFTYTSSAKLKLESKEDLKKAGFPSPDAADSLALAFTEDAGFSKPVAMVGALRESGGFRWKT